MWELVREGVVRCAREGGVVRCAREGGVRSGRREKWRGRKNGYRKGWRLSYFYWCHKSGNAYCDEECNDEDGLGEWYGGGK